jgi:hypothetical protein
MPWTPIALASICFALLCLTKNVAFGLLCLVLFVLFLLASVVQWLAMRINSGSRNDARILTPEELRAWREQAQEKRAAANNTSTGGTQRSRPKTEAPPPPSVNP